MSALWKKKKIQKKIGKIPSSLPHSETCSAVSVINFWIFTVRIGDRKGVHCCIAVLSRHLERKGHQQLTDFMFHRLPFSTKLSRQAYPLYQRPVNHLNVRSFLNRFAESQQDSTEPVTLTGNGQFRLQLTLTLLF